MNSPRPASRARIAVLIALAVVAVTAVAYWREPLWAIFADQEAAQEWVASMGPWGPLVSVGLNAVQVVLAPVPGYVIGLANGYLYGVWLGALYTTLGLLVGSAIAMGLGRALGRPLVEKLVRPATLSRWDRLAARRGPVFFFLIFLVPGLPDDLVCFVIGLSNLPIPTMVILAVLGRLPGVVFSSLFGAYATQLPPAAWIPIVAATAALGLAFVKWGDRMENVALRAIRRLAPGRASEGADEIRSPAGDRQEPD